MASAQFFCGTACEDVEEFMDEFESLALRHGWSAEVKKVSYGGYLRGPALAFFKMLKLSSLSTEQVQEKLREEFPSSVDYLSLLLTARQESKDAVQFIYECISLASKAGVSDEKQIVRKLKNEQKDEAPPISYFKLFRYTTTKDKIYILISIISCIISGCVTPLNTIVFANFLNAMVLYGMTMGLDGAADVFLEAVMTFVIWNIVLGAILMIFVYLSTVLMNRTAYNQVFVIRQEYLKAALNQDFAWYDLHESGDFASKMAEDLVKLEDGINEKVATFVYYMVCFLSSIIMALIKGWKLALICLTTFPVTLILVGSVSFVAGRLGKQESEAYGRAASVAEEVLSSIRTVFAFSGQDKEVERYSNNLQDAKKINIKRNFFTGCAMGVLFFCIYGSYALSFWYGVKLLQDPMENYDPATMIAVFFGVLMGSMNFGMSTPLIEIFGVAKGAGAQIFYLIDKVPEINPLLDRGVKPATVEGNLEFENVHFSYPSRPDVPVLKGVDLTVKRGQTVALVGASGCGKSTIIQLISRFYDRKEGSIKLDGNNVRDLSVTWLREQIGLVGQEPVLFNTTIGENIRYGREDATSDEVVAAAKAANAHHFISMLPKGYDMLVGDRGTQLSGGQKQRIAIARALIRNPSILLLDEATSALDNTSEAIVQAALEKARQGRTTLIVAHRLSTIRTADLIYVFKDGRVVESGTHQELMKSKGNYYDMVVLQTMPGIDGNNADDPVLNRQVSAISRLSDSGEELEKPEITEDVEEETRDVSFCEVLSYSKPEWYINTIACFCSLIIGFGTPLFSVLFGDFIATLSSDDQDMVNRETNRLAVIFLMLGTVTGIVTFLQVFLFGIAGERLTERMRNLMFSAMLRQEVGYFDDKKNSTGALCARLSGEASYVQGATGQRIGTVLQGMGTLGLGVGLAMFYEWRLGLVILAFAPFIILLAYKQMSMARIESFGTAKTMQESTKIAVDVVSNMRTVASLGRERMFLINFTEQLVPGLRLALKGTHIRGIVYALSRSMMYFTFAAAMYYGGYLIVSEGVPFDNVLKTSQALIMSTMSLGQMFAFAPNFQKGINAAGRIITLLVRAPKIRDPVKAQIEKFSASGDAALINVHFAYPTRPSVEVLRGIGLDVRRGSTVALVGASGCGKSTVIQLLERFYEPSQGDVYLDRIPIRNLKMSESRKNIGLVQQEPILFDRTIAENIAYGDNQRNVSQNEITEAARQANIHNFVTSLPLGYETRLGSKGTQLSGGQKQRIAIARALLRNPKILLLDEATSALDAESEKVVQEALDKAKEGRTCITIAHRLTTVQDADAICVFHHGKIGEIGTHAQLMARKGIYYRLYQSN